MIDATVASSWVTTARSPTTAPGRSVDRSGSKCGHWFDLPWSPRVLKDFELRFGKFLVIRNCFQIFVDWGSDEELVKDLVRARLGSVTSVESPGLGWSVEKLFRIRSCRHGVFCPCAGSDEFRPADAQRNGRCGVKPNDPVKAESRQNNRTRVWYQIIVTCTLFSMMPALMA